MGISRVLSVTGGSRVNLRVRDLWRDGGELGEMTREYSTLFTAL
jgi:hypothetical protein